MFNHDLDPRPVYPPHLDLPYPISAFIRAVNAGELGAVLDTFADRALVNDQLCEHWNKNAIADWAARDVIGQRLALRVRSAVTNHAHAAVVIEVDGDFDKRGLPEPLVVSFYFSTHDDKIVQLLILRTQIEMKGG